MSDWQQVALGEICSIEIGGTPSRSESRYWWKSEDDGARLPWVSISDMKEKVITDTKESITEIGSLQSNCKHVPKGTLLMSFKLTIGRLAFAGRDLYTNEAISAIRPFTDVCPEFLYYGLQHWNLTGDSDQAVKGVTLNKQKLQEIPCLLPPLPEQKKIAEILSGVDNQIAKQQRKKCKYLHLLAGIIDRLMTHGTRGRKTIETDAGCIPENWKVGRVEDFFVLGRGRVISIPFIKEHPGPYPVFSSQSKNNGEMGRMDTFDFDGDYFTWTTDGAYAGSVFARSGKFNCTNVCGTGKAKSPAESDSKFAAYFLQRVAKRHVSYVGNPKLMNNTFADIPFALPPLDEQKEIIAVIDSVKKNIELVEGQIVSLSNLKRSVSSDLLTGRKRVTL